MALYYQSSSEIQPDGLQTLYLMNPNFTHYSDTQNNALFLNPAAGTPHAPPHQNQHFVGMPLSQDPGRAPPVLDIPAPRHHYNAWGSADQSASGNNHEQPNIPLLTPRGLSLSLSGHHQTAGGIISPSTSTSRNGVNSMQSVIMGSKYLKAAQELLDEVANVGNESKAAAPAEARDKAKAIKETNASSYRTELSAAQRQEIQMKKAKLNSMLDEVEQRCRQYHHQMHIIVTTFEQAAGVGSAHAYTHLALKTILKQFRCLKSTIASQIKGFSRSLGEEEGTENKLEGSRLKFVDTQVRQMQQMGMMQGNAWRPQRGLPERAVSLLRAWLFEHFLHPYPKDSDKQMLAKQTGLTRSQVSNWFINARVRLWKPMVEEMYLEETKNQDPIPDLSIKPEPDNHPSGSAPSPPPQISPSTLSPHGFSLPPRTNFAQLITSLNIDNQKTPKKPRTAAPEITTATANQKNYLPMADADANANRYGFGDFGADQHLAPAGYHGNAAFSLSLSLPPAEQQFLSHRSFELGTQIEPGALEGNRMNEGYEMLDFQNRKPFPAQLLPDFVA